MTRPNPVNLNALRGNAGKRPERALPSMEPGLPDPPDDFDAAHLAEWNQMGEMLVEAEGSNRCNQTGQG